MNSGRIKEIDRLRMDRYRRGTSEHTLARRRDIDGLRALAVLPIFIFHINESWMPGGFIGVDVFFVISGFLIGGIVYRGAAAGTFSIIDFYERRFRRILPPLFAMIVGVMALGWIVLLPVPFVNFAKSSIAATLSVSNLFFERDSENYFALGSAVKPLLHTWSLGVEEQFYLFFPLGLLALVKVAPRWTREIVLFATAASLIGSEHYLYHSADKTFYFLPTRAWELLLGFLIVLYPPRICSRPLYREFMAATGLALIIWALIFYRPGTPFPGMNALLPCGGAALIIAAGSYGETAVSRVLSLSPFVFIGLISYSLYLWHWPIIVLLREAMPVVEFTPIQGIAILLAGIAMGWMSWTFIEKPFRKGFSRKAIFSAATASAATLVVLGMTLVQHDGYPSRFPPQVSQMASYLKYSGHVGREYGTCFYSGEYNYSYYQHDPCLSLSHTQPNVALVGDSHAGHLLWGLRNSLPEVNFVPVVGYNCHPHLNPRALDKIHCARLWHFAFNRYLKDNHFDLVVLSAAWDAREVNYIAPMVRALRAMGQRVVLVGPVLRYKTSAPKLLALALLRGDMSIAQSFFDNSASKVDNDVRAIAATEHVPYVSALDILCSPHCLQIAKDGAPIQFDQTHLTDEGSLAVGKAMKAVLQSELSRAPARLNRLQLSSSRH